MNYLYWFNKILKKAFSGDKLSEKHRNNRRGFNMFKLIAFDLDGTLLDDRKQIPEENLRALRYAAEKGVHLVPATGRLLCAIPEQLAALPFIRYHILINGAKVYDAKEQRIISTAEIPRETALSLIEHGRELGCYYDCYHMDMGYMEKDMYDSLEDYISNPATLSFMRSVRKPVDDLAAYISENAPSVQKVQFFFKDMDERAHQLQLLPELFPEIIAASSLSSNIEINSANAGKGPALTALCSFLGIQPEEAIAFGDGLNDTDMLSAAGLGIGMANSDPAIYSAVNRFTASNNEAGVAKAIYELI